MSGAKVTCASNPTLWMLISDDGRMQYVLPRLRQPIDRFVREHGGTDLQIEILLPTTQNGDSFVMDVCNDCSSANVDEEFHGQLRSYIFASTEVARIHENIRSVWPNIYRNTHNKAGCPQFVFYLAPPDQVSAWIGDGDGDANPIRRVAKSLEEIGVPLSVFYPPDYDPSGKYAEEAEAFPRISFYHSTMNEALWDEHGKFQRVPHKQLNTFYEDFSKILANALVRAEKIRLAKQLRSVSALCIQLYIFRRYLPPTS